MATRQLGLRGVKMIKLLRNRKAKNSANQRVKVKRHEANPACFETRK